MTTWILIADRGRARVFARNPDEESWSKVQSFDFPEGRLRYGETQSDRPSLNISQGEGRYAPEPHADFRHTTAAAFSKDLVAYLERARLEKRFDFLWVAAPPLFLGEWRDHVTHTLKPLVRREWGKDLTNVPDSQIQAEVESLVQHDEAK
jgi:protein required for attachment to host cells